MRNGLPRAEISGCPTSGTGTLTGVELMPPSGAQRARSPLALAALERGDGGFAEEALAMASARPITLDQPMHDLVEDFELGDFELQSGAILKQARLAFAARGRLSAARDNVVL